MEYYSAIKGVEYCYMMQYGLTWKHDNRKKTFTKDHILYNTIYIKCPELAIHGDRKYISGCWGLGGGKNREGLLLTMEFLFGVKKYSKFDHDDGCMNLWVY